MTKCATCGKSDPLLHGMADSYCDEVCATAPLTGEELLLLHGRRTLASDWARIEAHWLTPYVLGFLLGVGFMWAALGAW